MCNCSEGFYQHYAHVVVRIFEKTLSTHLQMGGETTRNQFKNAANVHKTMREGAKARAGKI